MSGNLRDIIPIAERPPEVDERAVPDDVTTELHRKRFRHNEAERPVDGLSACLVAAETRKRTILASQIGDRVECNRSSQQSRAARDEQEHFLAAHAAANAVETTPLDPQPRQLVAEDRRHAREIVDLPRRAPGKEAQAPSLALRADDGEVAERWQITPRLGLALAGTSRPCGEIISGSAGCLPRPYQAGSSRNRRRR
ncbi:MAG: hypothetical protein H0X39_10595 [Actinobacteria bacterium]|nr:hypothetical protein [Actinomycetota bacterium]